MDIGIVKAALSVTEQGLRFLNEKQRMKYKKQLFELLQEIDDSENETWPDYSDDDTGKLQLKLQNYLVAFGSELRAAHLETLRQEEG